MPHQITIHGAPVQVQSFFRRDIAGEGGLVMLEVELTVMVQGRLPNRNFIQLTTQEPLRIGLPITGGEQVLFGMVADHQSINSGSGEGAVYRHDLTIREVPESATRRAAHASAAAAAAEAENPTPRIAAAVDEDADEDEPAATGGGAAQHLAVKSQPSVWGSAIAQMRNPTAARATLQDQPLAFAEMAGVEAVLVNLRVEALIEQLRAAGLVSRTAVDHSFQRLIRDRFLRDATPVVGEHAAKRAARQLTGDGG